jgi:hypothetical protein
MWRAARYPRWRSRIPAGLLVIVLLQAFPTAYVIHQFCPSMSPLRVTFLAPFVAAIYLVVGRYAGMALRIPAVRRAVESNRVLAITSLVSTIGFVIGAWLDIPHPGPPSGTAQLSILATLFLAPGALTARLLLWCHRRLHPRPPGPAGGFGPPPEPFPSRLPNGPRKPGPLVAHASMPGS